MFRFSPFAGIGDRGLAAGAASLSAVLAAAAVDAGAALAPVDAAPAALPGFALVDDLTVDALDVAFFLTVVVFVERFVVFSDFSAITSPPWGVGHALDRSPYAPAAT
jgi:hypothetical protein